MGLLERVRDYITGLEERLFNRYIIILFCGLIIVLGLFLFYHYRSISSLHEQIKRINRMRGYDIQAVLSKADYVQKQLQDMDTLLAEDRDFKIREYFENVLKKLNLTDKFTRMEPPRREMQDQYIKSILEVSFHDMDMKQLTELLKEFEENRRIFVEKLEIIKKPPKLEVNMTIGTFLLKAE